MNYKHALLLIFTSMPLFTMQFAKQTKKLFNKHSRFMSSYSKPDLKKLCSCQSTAFSDTWSPALQEQFEKSVLTRDFFAASYALADGAFIFAQDDAQDDILIKAIKTRNKFAVSWLINAQHFLKGSDRKEYFDWAHDIIQEDINNFKRFTPESIKKNIASSSSILEMLANAKYGCYSKPHSEIKEASREEDAKKNSVSPRSDALETRVQEVKKIKYATNKRINKRLLLLLADPEKHPEISM